MYYTVLFSSSTTKDDEIHTITRKKTLNTAYCRIGDVTSWLAFLKETIARAESLAQAREPFDLELTRSEYDKENQPLRFDRWYHTGYLEAYDGTGFYLCPDLKYTEAGSDLWFSSDSDDLNDLMKRL